MEIKEATERDTSAIVNLLKLSLGESLTPKSERYWRWKHLENPFGVSLVLLCWEGSELIGVRAFMRWEWIMNGKTFRAVRAVDTATHPDHQGQGIFKKLTLALVDHCKDRGDDFVFNTPNEQSKPGYLKMGWVEAGKLPIRMGIQRPFSIVKNLMTGAKVIGSNETSAIQSYLQHPSLATLLSQCNRGKDSISTNTSVAYLTWRYLRVPVAAYVGIAEEEGNELTGLIIGRIKHTRIGKELRVTDVFIRDTTIGNELKKKLVKAIRDWKVDYVSLSGALGVEVKNILPGLSLASSVGPMVTVRPLSNPDLQLLINFKQWTPALGDLELF